MIRCWGRAPTTEPRLNWQLMAQAVEARSEVQWLGLETLNWGAGTLVTAALEAEQLKERRRQ